MLLKINDRVVHFWYLVAHPGEAKQMLNAEIARIEALAVGYRALWGIADFWQKQGSDKSEKGA